MDLNLIEIQLFRIDKVSTIFGVSKSTIWLWIRQKKFPSPIKINGTTVWKLSDLNEFIESHSK
jgi:predicted DNA-binding transcriptional regulator AlpA